MDNRTIYEVVSYVTALWSINQDRVVFGFHYATGEHRNIGFGRDLSSIYPRDVFHLFRVPPTGRSIIIITGLSHVVFVILHIVLLLQEDIRESSIFDDMIVTRSKHRQATMAIRTLSRQIDSGVIISNLMSQTYTSCQTGFLFRPNTCHVCHRCGCNGPLCGVVDGRCPVCVTSPLSSGNMIVHDTDIVATIIHAVGGPEKCNILSADEFVSLCSNILHRDDFAVPGMF